MFKNQFIPDTVSSNMTVNRIDFYNRYINGQISLRDIPIICLSEKILIEAASLEPDNLINYLFDLCKYANMRINVGKYLDIIDKFMDASNYYFKYFMLDPIANYKKIKKSKRTLEMAKYLVKLKPENISIIDNKHRNREICELAFAHKSSLIREIPKAYITAEMCKKAIFDDFSLMCYVPPKYIDSELVDTYIEFWSSKEMDIDQAINLLLNGEWWESFYFFLDIPRAFSTQATYDKIFNCNCNLYILFPLVFKSYFMSKKIYEMYGDRVVEYIPQEHLEKIRIEISLKDNNAALCDFYFEEFKKNPLEKFDYIPLIYRTQRVYDLLFEVGGMDVIDMIPEEFRNQMMWDRFVFDSADIRVLKNIPEQFITGEMCSYLYSLFGSRPDALIYVPDKYLTKEMIIDLLNYNIYEGLKRISVSMLDEELLIIIVSKLKKIINTKKTVKANPELVNYIIKLYPYLSKVFDKDSIKCVIENELYELIVNEGTIESIALKYGVSVQYINNVLEDIKNKDIGKYETIKQILDLNQNRWFFNMQMDVSNLDLIIIMLGDIKNNRLDMSQKIKFAYLYMKYINNKLEDIYNFNYNKYSSKDYSNVDSFFRRILRYNYIFGKDRDISTISEVKTIEFNNGWLKKYDRNRFFAIKDGKINAETRYNDGRDLLTLDIEKKIVDELIVNNIPLNETIVKGAFREYFNGKLDEYIKQFIGYDMEFENIKKERGRK